MIAVLGLGAICAACGSDSPPEGQVGFVEENFGGVVSDEPRSALIGRDILSSGGSAVDAIVATYFTMAVTYPGAATLGGGGVCVVHRGDEGTIEAIDFRPALYASGNRGVMIPGAVRGMFALHARYGRLKWEALLLPAERLARFGNPVPRAFARAIGGLPPAAFADADFRRIFLPDGKPVTEGQVLRQPELSSILAGIRLRGPGEFYAGDLARKLAADLGALAGIDVPVDAFRSYRPKWLKTEIVNVGKDELHLPAGPDGQRAAAAWRRLADGAGPGVEFAGGAFDSAGFVATDLTGGTAACVVTANGTIGAGRIIGHTGILAAAPPRGPDLPGLPMILVNRPLNDARGAVAGSGGSAGALRALQAAVAAFDDGRPIGTVLSALPSGGPPTSTGRVNAIHCPKGAREEPELCRFAADPAGHGLAVSAGF